MKNVLKHEQTFAPNFRDVTQFFLCIMRSVNVLRIGTTLTGHILDVSLTQTKSYVQSQFLSCFTSLETGKQFSA